MGCDIHAFVEFKKKDSEYWDNIGAEFRLDRNYHMFTLLAGVRAYSGENPVFPVRGLPDDLNHITDDGAYIHISETITEGRYCTLEKAKTWDKYGRKILYRDDKPWKVEDPDTHTHSWLLVDEYDTVIKEYENTSKDRQWDMEYKAVLTLMKFLEEYNNDVRLVFWFDN